MGGSLKTSTREARPARACVVTEITPAHWIRPNHVTRIPTRHVIFDTEAHRDRTGGVECQMFRCGAASFDRRDKAGRPWAEPMRATFSTSADLWEWITDRTAKGRRTVVVAHNLAYDLRVSDAFGNLARLGWELTMIRLDGGSAWGEWRSEGRTLTCVDSMSWFGVGLESVGVALGMAKLDLPAEADSDEAWLARCTTDVEILRSAWLAVLGWIQAADLGTWKPTGAGQGWAAFRHRWMDVPILHHGIGEIAAVEREATYTGRCEAWRHGPLTEGPFTEWDYSAAYAEIALSNPVPVRLAGHVGRRDAERALGGREGAAFLLRCRVDTETPTAPLRGPEGILWPVGTFTTWLWDVEADLVRREGGHVEALEGYRYVARPALRTWATWILDALDADPDTLAPVLRLIVKGWSRTTVGRFGASWSGWEDYGESFDPGLRLAHAYNGDNGRSFRLLSIGDRTWAEAERRDAPDSAIAVLSWIMAACRVRLWSAMRYAGLDHVAYCDTDGVLVDQAGDDALSLAQLPGLRRKSVWRRVDVMGPRQLILDGKLKAAGVPSSARRLDAVTWEGEVWRSLPTAIEQGEVDRVIVSPRTWEMRGVDHRRTHLPGGRTGPIRVMDGVECREGPPKP